MKRSIRCTCFQMLLLTVAIIGVGKKGICQQVSIDGPTCIHTGFQYYNYLITAYYSGTSDFTYRVSGGTLATGGTTGTHSGPGSVSIPVVWSGAGVITMSSPAGSTQLYVYVAPTFLPGTISSGGSQTIDYNTVPSTINVSAAAGGPCVTPEYIYQWQQSPDNINFLDIPGATSQNLAFSAAATQTTYYRRFVTETESDTTGYANTAAILLNPPNPILPVNGGSITPASQTINYNTVPAAMSSTGVGGGTYTYSYQWQSSTDDNTWSNVPCGATMYSPSNLTSTTYYRIAVTSNGVTGYSQVETVNVYPPLKRGVLTPVPITVLPGGNPGLLSFNVMPTGGNGSYNYQWQSSTDGVNFSNISTALSQPTYSPGPLFTNSWYRVIVSSNGVSATTNTEQISVSTATQDINFVQARSILKAGVMDTATAATLSSSNDVMQTTQYFDGLGRQEQTVAMQQSPLGDDMVTINVYDGFGREALKYLSYTASTNDGNFKSTAVADQYNFNAAQFPGEKYYYGQISYEPSPLNRVLATYSPGMNWEGSVRGISAQYEVNTAADSVMIWTIDMAMGSIPISSTSYSSGTLYKNISIDENNNQVIEYTDVAGRVILKKTQQSVSTGSGYAGWLCTYYVYDVMDNLRFVISPKAVQWLTANGWSFGASGGAAVASELCFRYEYDYRKRMIIKKVPGAGENWMVYDIRNRLVMTEDSNLRRSGQWLVTQYDGLNRPVETGLINYASTLAALQQQVTNITASGGAIVSLPVDTTISGLNTTGDIRAARSITGQNGFSTADGGTFIGEIVNGNWGSGASTSNSNSISLSPVPSGVTLQPLTLTYYDDYSWVSGTGTALPSTFASAVAGNGNYFIGSSTGPVYARPVTPLLVTRGEVTGTQTFVLGSSGQYLSSINFYDDRARLIQTQAVNYTGGLDTVTTQYDFTGKPLRSLLGQAKPTNAAQYHQVLTKTNYDANFRVTSIYKNIDGAAADQLIDSMQYNELGQLQTKRLGLDPSTGAPLDNVTYDYNIRGWVTGINKAFVSGTAQHYFGMELGYDNATSVAGTSYVNRAYNGNIAGTVWKSAGDGVNRKYDFTYDNVNRLTGAAYLDNHTGSGWDASAMDYSVSGLTYDANGNIGSMIQKGFRIGNPTGMIDSLTYAYKTNSNKLFQVHDGANDTASTLGDFHYKGAKADSDYRYDGNGSLTLDNNKGIDTIVYNYLNLPQRVHMKGKGNIFYTYDATGNKLTKQTVDSVAKLATTTLYLDGFQYQRRTSLTNTTGGSDTLQFVGHEEGRARWAFQKFLSGDSVYSWQYDFVERDHLGNTRVLLSQEKDTAQYVATMEAANRITENALFYGVDSTAYARADIPGYPDDLSVTTPNDSVSRVNGDGPKVGPAIILKVMSGDKVDLAVQYYYNSKNDDSASTLTPQNLLNSLATGLATLSGPAEASLATLNNGSSSPLVGALTSSIGNQTGTLVTKPQAYLNWMLLDDQFNYVAGGNQSGALQVGGAGVQSNGALQAPLCYNGLPINKSGYLYIYVSNATPGWDVFFDNLNVKHYSGPLVEENHYYPFGLTMAGISDKAVKWNYAGNKYRFNRGSELQNKEFSDGAGLEMYETSLRELDPQLGRWWQVDSKPTESESPYSAMGNNPILVNDPLGDSVPAPNLKYFADRGLVKPKADPNGDQTGLIKNATVQEKKDHPVQAFLKDLLHGLADITLLNKVDDISADVRSKNDNGDLNIVNGTQAAVGILMAVPGENPEENEENASGLGDLTNEEVGSIQKTVDEAGRPLEVVGSAAKGTRRGVGTGLPIGKGRGTKSDIDYISHPSHLPYLMDFQQGLPGIDPQTGIVPGVSNPYLGPSIRFEPSAAPQTIPAQN